MKKSLAILLASAALTTVIGLPALAAFNSADGLDSLTSKIGFGQKHFETATLRVAESDDDHAEHGYAAHGDDDDHYKGEDDDCDDDEGNRYGSDDDVAMTCDTGNNPAQAGTTAPPQNGLFANGTTPSVQVN